MPWRLLADLVLALHVAVVVFNVGGLLAILVGGWRGWDWVRSRRFRLAHLGLIAFVALEAWLGMICPLTDLEMALRRRGGETAYPGSFIAHWLERLLYVQAPAWAFTVGYTLFAALVAASWWWVRPRPPAAPS